LLPGDGAPIEFVDSGGAPGLSGGGATGALEGDGAGFSHGSGVGQERTSGFQDGRSEAAFGLEIAEGMLGPVNGLGRPAIPPRRG
jgi:hypothetical protein